MAYFLRTTFGIAILLGVFFGGSPGLTYAEAPKGPTAPLGNQPGGVTNLGNSPTQPKPLINNTGDIQQGTTDIKDTTVKNRATGIVCGDGRANIPGCQNNSISFGSVRTKFLPNFSIFQLAFTGLVAVVVVTMAGIFLVASLGDPGKKKKAMGMVYNALIAIFVAMLAYVIVQLVLGLDFAVTASIPSALAQGTSQLIPSPPSGQGVNIPVGSESQNLGYFAQAGLNVLFYVVGPIVVIAFFLIGIKLVMSEGKDDDFKKGMKAMGYAALGLSFIGLAYAVVRTALSIKF